jgi:hypothetical protein
MIEVAADREAGTALRARLRDAAGAGVRGFLAGQGDDADG